MSEKFAVSDVLRQETSLIDEAGRAIAKDIDKQIMEALTEEDLI